MKYCKYGNGIYWTHVLFDRSDVDEFAIQDFFEGDVGNAEQQFL